VFGTLFVLASGIGDRNSIHALANDSDMCIHVERVQVVVSYIIPMLGLYWHEMTERYQFAKSKGLELKNFATCFWHDFPTFSGWVLMSVLTAIVFYKDAA
jgi:hypothetical protein